MVLPPLLATKFFFPPARANLVFRPRLVQKLNEGLQGPLTLVSAPAGYGKTTLMSEWREGKGRDYLAAWISLDADENDLMRFLSCVIAVLRTLKPEFAEAALHALKSPQPPPEKWALTVMINELGEFSEPFALIMDDYQVITSQSVHAALIYLLDHLPPQMHIIMLTRADPPLPLARMRARNQICEIRAADLRFTPSETADFLSLVMGVHLAPQEVAALNQHTEGWAAGLQLAGLSMRGRDELPDFIASFGGGHHYIVDYLAEEVLDQQPETLRMFLLQTSVLDRMTGPLCEALTGQRNGQVTLEQLEKANLFVAPLGEERCWYRYHQLFAEVLGNCLQRDYPDQVNVLHLRAAEWFERNQLIPDAINQTLSARDYSHTARLIEQNAWKMMREGQTSRLMEWLAVLPEELIASRPELSVVHAWGMFIIGKEDLMFARVQKLEESVFEGESAEISLLRAIGARWRGEKTLSRSLLERAMDRLPNDNFLMRTQARISLGRLEQDADLKKARRAFAEAAAIGEASGDVFGSLTALRFLAETLRMQGALFECHAVCEHAIKLSEEQPYSNAAGYVRLGMADLLYEWNDLQRATKYLHEANDLAQSKGMSALQFSSVLGLARIHRSLGDVEKAQQHIWQAEQLAQQAVELVRIPAHTYMTAQVDHEQTLLWLLQNRLIDAEERISQASMHNDLPVALGTLVQLAQARVWIARGKRCQALQMLSPVVEKLEIAGMKSHLAQALLLEAMALDADGQDAQAFKALSHALSIAEPEGFMRSILGEGASMIQMLRRAKSQGIAPQYISKLISAFVRTSPTSLAIEQPLIEPLSKRELEVLGLIAEGCSNKEIASRLFITISTVKRHTVTIFQKLGVDSRTQAVAVARELELL